MDDVFKNISPNMPLIFTKATVGYSKKELLEKLSYLSENDEPEGSICISASCVQDVIKFLCDE